MRHAPQEGDACPWIGNLQLLGRSGGLAGLGILLMLNAYTWR
jgi:hypothetical protein